MEDSVSIIIPSFNRKDNLAKVINSYLCQENLYELIFVDDGSTDGTYEYLQEVAKSDSRIKIERNPKNLGLPNSRNVGISIATGKYIMFGEDDVVVKEDYVHVLLRCAKETNADIVAGRLIYLKYKETFENAIERCEKNGNKPLMSYWAMAPAYWKPLEKPVEMPFFHAIAVGKAEVYKKILFDPVYKGNSAREETDFYIRAGKQGYKIFLCPRTICFHLTRKRNDRGGTWKVGILKFQYFAIRNNIIMIDRHYDYLKKWGMKGNKFTFKMIHIFNRIRMYIFPK